jgi:formylglycine-generating enzyme required for sulfatase activity
MKNNDIAQPLEEESMMIVATFARRVQTTLAVIALVLIGCGVAVSAPRLDSGRPGQSFRDCADCPEMVIVPAGSFVMGAPEAETARELSRGSIWEVSNRYALAQEHPQHSVKIGRPFALGKYPVTRGEYAAFVRSAHYAVKGECLIYDGGRYTHPAGSDWRSAGFTQTDRDPVVCASWNDAEAYIAWLNGRLHSEPSFKHNDPYRLPSETEWEYSARAGTPTARWWGDRIGTGNADCNGCGSQWDNQRTAPVGSFRPNPFALNDMLGGVWQWTEDCWHKDYLGAPANGDPWITADCPGRVMRGGNWHNDPWVVRSAGRTFNYVNERTNYIGFRVARNVP